MLKQCIISIFHEHINKFKIWINEIIRTLSQDHRIKLLKCEVNVLNVQFEWYLSGDGQPAGHITRYCGSPDISQGIWNHDIVFQGLIEVQF